jgi:hypothetical protein
MAEALMKGEGLFNLELGPAVATVLQAGLWTGVGYFAAEAGTELLAMSFDDLAVMLAESEYNRAGARLVVGLGVTGLVGGLMYRYDEEAAKSAVPFMLAGVGISAAREVARPLYDQGLAFVRGLMPGSSASAAGLGQYGGNPAGDEQYGSAGDVLPMRAGASPLGSFRAGGLEGGVGHTPYVSPAQIGRTEILPRY